MTDQPTRLILVRHAEPSPDAGGRCYGSLDVGLSDQGVVQAAALADALSATDIAAVFSSPRTRALKTAEPVAHVHALPLLVNDDLRELDFGELEGRRYDEIAAAMPALYEKWMMSPTTVKFPGGESFSDLRLRALAASARIRTDHAGSTSLLVTHGGVCRAIVADALNLAPELIFRIDIGHARALIIDWFADDPVIRAVNTSALELPFSVGAFQSATACARTQCCAAGPLPP